MSSASEKYLSQWLEKAGHDLLAARLILDHNPIILDIACFHCQQAVEKYLKAFLVFKNEAFPQTHNLDLLLQLCRKHDNNFDDIDLKNLEDFAVRGRYPHDFISPEPEESELFYQDAVIVKTIVSKKIQEKYPAIQG